MSKKHTDDELDRILGNLVRAVHLLESDEHFPRLMPEVRVNIAFAPAGASRPEEVAAIEGRITACGGRAKAAGYPRLGASDHMARLLIEVGKYDATYRAGINFAWTDALASFLEDYARDKGWKVGRIDRTQEPEDVSRVDKKSMPWKIQQLFSAGEGKIPKLFYESEGWGKEPLFVLLGEDAVEVAREATEIARAFAEANP